MTARRRPRATTRPRTKQRRSDRVRTPPPAAPRAATRPSPVPARPRAMRGLQVNEVEDGYIVYQPEQNRVHYLNHTAAVVFGLCTGKNTWDEIIELVQRAYGLKRAPSRAVRGALTRLVEEGLVGLRR